MKIRTIITLLLLLVVTVMPSSRAWSQKTITSSISGVVIDGETNEPMVGATVTISGSSKGAISDADGAFTIINVKSTGAATVSFNFLGYKPQEVEMELKSGKNTMENITLLPDNMKIDEVVVTGSAPTAKQIGDTTQFNAGAYKTNPDATAQDLLAKMPGFSVSDDGKASAEGESITQVYVDGKAYFKNDPTTALNSLPAGAVESIQLFDEKSDKAKFTGVDDGDRKKTINIVTKAKKNSIRMGDFIGGYGTDGRYNAKANVNIFEGDHRITFGFGLNNINQEAISGNRYYGRYGTSGIKDASGIKLNYSGEFKKDDQHKTELGVSYIFTRDFTQNLSSTTQDGLIVDEYYETEENRRYLSTNHNIYVDLETTQGKNRVFFRPYASISGSGSNIDDYTIKQEEGNLTNEANTYEHNGSNSYNVGGSLRWMHRLDDKNSLIFGSRTSFSRSNSDQLLRGTTSSFDTNIDMLVDSLINQNKEVLSGSNSVTGSIGYSYAIKPNQGLHVEYEIDYDWSDSDNKTYLYNHLTGFYEDISESLSNEFERDYLTQEATIGYSIRKQKAYNLSIRAGYERSDLQNNSLYPTTYTRDYGFNSVSANIRGDYSFNESTRLMLNYNGRPSLPSISQLQDVLNVSDPLRVSTGNPNLDQGYTNTLMFRFTSSNMEKSTAFNLFGYVNNRINGFTNSVRQITSDTTINGVAVQKGAQLSTTENMSGGWFGRTGFYYSVPLDFISSKLNTGMSYTYTRNPSIYNGVANFTTSNGGSFNFAVNSNISQNIDFTIGNTVSYTRSATTSKGVPVNNYITNVAHARVNLIFLKNFVFNTDYAFNYSYYSSGGVKDPEYHLLNSGLGYKFLKGNAELRVSGYDLLNQGKSLRHSTSSLYITDTESTTLERYFMLTFSYKFNNMKPGMKMPQTGMRYGPMGGHGHR